MADIKTIVEYSEDLATQEAPPLLPVDVTYPATIKAAEVKTSLNTGNEYYSVTWHISADVYPPDFIGGDPNGETITYNRLSAEDNPKARFAVKRFVETIGAVPSRTVNTSEWIGQTAGLELKVTEYEGQQRLEIAKVKRL